VFLFRFILQVVAGALGLFLAKEFVPGVEIIDSVWTLVWCSLFLGLINAFIRPILNLITLPLRLITFGLFSLVINMAIIWAIDILFPELIIIGIAPLFYTTLIIWALSIIIPKLIPKRKPKIIQSP
jgi:putative membrane protein